MIVGELKVLQRGAVNLIEVGFSVRQVGDYLWEFAGEGVPVEAEFEGVTQFSQHFGVNRDAGVWLACVNKYEVLAGGTDE